PKGRRAILFSQLVALDDRGAQGEIAERHADAGEYERHPCETELMGREEMREDDRRCGGRRLRGRLPGQLPPYAPGDPGPQPGWALNRARFLNLLYDRTASSGSDRCRRLLIRASDEGRPPPAATRRGRSPG